LKKALYFFLFDKSKFSLKTLIYIILINIKKMGNVQSKVMYSSIIVQVDSNKLEYNIVGNSISVSELLSLINEYREHKITKLYKHNTLQSSNGRKIQRIELKENDMVNSNDQLFTS
jgi:hypothetical protein